MSQGCGVRRHGCGRGKESTGRGTQIQGQMKRVRGPKLMCGASEGQSFVALVYRVVDPSSPGEHICARRACSSVGQSTRLIIARSWVRVPPGPLFPDPAVRGIRDFFVAARERLANRSWVEDRVRAKRSRLSQGGVYAVDRPTFPAIRGSDRQAAPCLHGTSDVPELDPGDSLPCGLIGAEATGHCIDEMMNRSDSRLQLLDICSKQNMFQSDDVTTE